MFYALADFCLVAHRLRTVIDYDRLIVLDKGEVSFMLVLIFFCRVVDHRLNTIDS